jgi:hypothetical protein
MPEYFKLTRKNRFSDSQKEEEYYAIREGKAIRLVFYGNEPTAIMRANPKHNKVYYEKKRYKSIIEKPKIISALDFAQRLIQAKRKLLALK